MKYLFIHQKFPGQYRHIIKYLASQDNNQIIALGIEELQEEMPNNVQYLRYGINRGNTEGIHQWLLEIDSKIIRAEACTNAAYKLKKGGFEPDIICAHPGWGEALFIKEIWPHIPLLSYQEFYYNTTGFDFGFDKRNEIPSWEEKARVKMKNTNPLLMLDISDWNVSPTKFQRCTFPQIYQERISVIHDGIDTDRLKPMNTNAKMIMPNGKILEQKNKIITFVNRSLEPYRGIETLIKAIPYIQEKDNEAELVIIGDERGSSYGASPKEGTWKDRYLNDISGHYSKSKVHFVGHLDYNEYIALLQMSSCHIYLTYPFVLSWSMLEAMSTGLCVIGSRTSPVTEIINNGENGIITDFFDSKELANNIIEVLANEELRRCMGSRARNKIIDEYSIKVCLPKQLALIEAVRCRILGKQ